MNKGQLYFFVAPTRAGKTTMADKWVKYQLDIHPDGRVVKRTKPGEINYYTKVKTEENPRVIVSGDDIRLALTGQRFFTNAEYFVQAQKYIMVHALLNRGHDVLLDSTNTTERSIRNILSQWPDAIPYHILATRDTCKERALKTYPDLVERGIVDRMFDSMTKLSKKYGGVYNAVERIREDYL